MVTGLTATLVGALIATSTVGTATPIPPPYVPPPIVKQAPKPTKEQLCSCVLYLRKYLGVPVYGDAWDLAPNVPKADVQEGDVAIIDYPNTSHVALIVDVEGDTVKIKESNFKRCKETTREIALSTVSGIYRPTA